MSWPSSVSGSSIRNSTSVFALSAASARPTAGISVSAVISASRMARVLFTVDCTPFPNLKLPDDLLKKQKDRIHRCSPLRPSPTAPPPGLRAGVRKMFTCEPTFGHVCPAVSAAYPFTGFTEHLLRRVLFIAAPLSYYRNNSTRRRVCQPVTSVNLNNSQC